MRAFAAIEETIALFEEPSVGRSIVGIHERGAGREAKASKSTDRRPFTSGCNTSLNTLHATRLGRELVIFPLYWFA